MEVDANRASPAPPGSRRTLLWLLAGLAFVLGLTMPRFIYVGDPVSMRATTICLLRTGDISVPEELALRFGERGQYFYQNVDKGKWYSKYGLLNTFLYLPPLAVEWMWSGDLPQFHELHATALRRRVLLLNLWNILVTLVLAGYLYWSACRFATRPIQAAVFVLVAILGTFLWYYARAQTVEIFQVTLFTVAFYHLLRFGEQSRHGTIRSAAVHAGLVVLVTGLLCLSKLVFLPLLPIVAGAMLLLALAFTETEPRPLNLAALTGQARRQAPVLATVVAGLLVVSTVVLLANWFRFGSPWNNGYQQFAREQTLFQAPWEGLWGYLADPRKSILLYFPLLPLALLGIGGIPRGQRLVYSACWFGFLTMYGISASFVNWRGDWSYGPRYLIFALPVLSLPVVSLLARPWSWKFAKRVCVAGVLLLGLWTVSSPLSIQGMEYFAAFRAEQYLEQVDDPRVRAYFRKPHWVVNRDLRRFQMGAEGFPPLLSVREELSASQYDQVEESLRRVPLGNYYWLTVMESSDS